METSLTNSFVQVFISQALSIPISQKKGMFLFYGNLINKIQFIATVVSVREHDKKIEYVLDDGTGLLEAIEWKNFSNNSRESTTSLSSNLRPPPYQPVIGLIPKSKYQLGQLIRVRGKLVLYYQQRKLSIYHTSIETDPNQELLHWSDVLLLNKFLEKEQSKQDKTKS